MFVVNLKHPIRLKRPARDKHSSLLRIFANNGRNKFYKIWPRLKIVFIIKHFFLSWQRVNDQQNKFRNNDVQSPRTKFFFLFDSKTQLRAFLSKNISLTGILFINRQLKGDIQINQSLTKWQSLSCLSSSLLNVLWKIFFPNVFFQMSFVKCLLSNVFCQMSFAKCLLPNVFCQMSFAECLFSKYM